VGSVQKVVTGLPEFAAQPADVGLAALFIARVQATDEEEGKYTGSNTNTNTNCHTSIIAAS